jgi:hypothetical protein
MNSGGEVMKYRTRKQAVEYLRELGIPCGDNYLGHLAVTGEGPVFRYSGRHPIYSEADLDAWIESRLSPPRKSHLDTVVAQLNEGQQLPVDQTPTSRARKIRPRRQSSAEAPDACATQDHA